MSKVFIEETTLTAIGDAIREKTGTTDLIAPGNMPTQILAIVSGGGDSGDCNGLHVPEERLVIKDHGMYMFYNNNWNWFIELFGNKITTQRFNSALYMFTNASKLLEIPFEINFDGTGNALTSMFQDCNKLTRVPKMNNVAPNDLKNMFANCTALVEIPEDFCASWDWSILVNSPSYSGYSSSMFTSCYNLRSFPSDLISHVNPNASHYNGVCYGAFTNCFALEKIENIGVQDKATWTSNGFSSSFENCNRLKKLTFATQADGSPYTAKWKSQTIDLTKNVGYSSLTGLQMYCKNTFNETNQYTTDAGRDEYINGIKPDGWTDSYGYSAYALPEAVETIKSLPDTSAHLASVGGTNTIKFKSLSGSQLPNKKIGDMKEEDIALAAAKGWTVTLT